MFNKQGQKIENKKTPPWPWEVLPDPIIKFGKKAWLTSSIDQWILRMSARSAEAAVRALTDEVTTHE